MTAATTLADPLASAYPLLDAARLSELVDAEVCAGGLRHKPGRSTSAALVDPAGGAWGWAQVLLGQQPEKVANARRRAGSLGAEIRVRAVPEVDGVLLAGRVRSDPRLHRGLRALATVVPDVDAAVAAGAVEVLRYNALRRLVVRGTGRGELPASLVVRVTAERSGDHRALGELARRGVPVLTPLSGTGIPHSRHLSVWPWVDGADLTRCHAAGAAHVEGSAHAAGPAPAAGSALAAGAGLARLHAVAGAVDGAAVLDGIRPGEAPDIARGRVLAAALAIAPDLRPRLDAILERVPPPSWEPTTVVHGDFSADQVIAGRDGVCLIDLDRLRRGDPHEDLGCFAAAELRRTGGVRLLEELLEGYGRPVRRRALTTWTVHALLLRLTEPFRAASPTWRDDLDLRLDEVERVLREGVL